MVLDFAPGAVGSDIQVTGTEYALLSTPGVGTPQQALLKLDLYPPISFNAPVTVSITLTDPAMKQFLMNQTWPALRFFDPETHLTEVISATYEPVTGRIIAPLT